MAPAALSLSALVAKATSEGLDPLTPALAIARATRPDQQVVAAPIGELPTRIAQADLPGPVLVMLGQVFEAQLQPGETSSRAEAKQASRRIPQ